MNILLVEPDFPIPSKSKNHKNFLPIGLLKIASYLRDNGVRVNLVRGIPRNIEVTLKLSAIDPDEIWITSLFTYWAKYVREAVYYYREVFPDAELVVGGIYASLLPKEQVMEYTGCQRVWQGVFHAAENYFPAYDLIKDANPHPLDYQIIHTSRGCNRRCNFCGTWKIEPVFSASRSIKDQIKYKKLVFYDNNLLMNPYVEDIIQELIELRRRKQIVWCESQSGFDGRILLGKPHLAGMLRNAGFRYPRIAWDWRYKEQDEIYNQIDLLKDAGYPLKDIFIFMLYNWDIPFEEMEAKRLKCWEWGVQIADCRYRPLNQLYDDYNPQKLEQTTDEYYIHSRAGWTDLLIKQFRKNVREQNICVRHGFPFYSSAFERKKCSKDVMSRVRNIVTLEEKTKFLSSIQSDFWFPSHTRYPQCTVIG